MRQINEQADKDNWFNALISILAGKNEVFLDYILDPVRYASAFLFYDISQPVPVLTWGAVGDRSVLDCPGSEKSLQCRWRL